MNKQDIEQIEKNRVIAEFMQLEKDYESFRLPYDPIVYLVNGYWMQARKLKYHSDWSWLMPVVEKIAKISPDDVVHMEFGKTYTRCNYWSIDSGRTHCFDESEDTPIQTVYKAVYQFIVWYNENVKKETPND